MTLNDYRDKAYKAASDKGFHNEINENFAQFIALIHSELSEALEADRNDRWVDWVDGKNIEEMFLPETVDYQKYVKGTAEEEIADAIIRLCDLAGVYRMNLDWHVKAKMAYNEKRPYKQGKKY